jgi:GTP cyclohydrolase IA
VFTSPPNNWRSSSHWLHFIRKRISCGLSKLNRIVEHFGRRGAIQEQLTSAIHNAVNQICEGNLGVIITIVATHNCVSCRGVKHRGAAMVTTKASGVFRHNGNGARQEFFDSLKINNGGHQI